MKYLRKFNSLTDYNNFKKSSNYITPNVCLIEYNKQKVYKFNDSKYNGYTYVDLGLPSGTLWAEYNVGANSPEEYGLLFAWGDTIGHTANDIYDGRKEFIWSDYTFSNDLGVRKYCTDTAYGAIDNKTVLDLEDDAAHVHMGGEWHIPTKAQIKELTDNTISEWTTFNSIYGRVFASKINGNTLFIPAAGYGYNGTFQNAGLYGRIWSSSLDVDDSTQATYWNFYDKYVSIDNGTRACGHSVRGVIG